MTSAAHCCLRGTGLVLEGALSSPGIVSYFIQSLYYVFLNYFLLNLKFCQQARGGNMRLSLSQEQSLKTKVKFTKTKTKVKPIKDRDLTGCKDVFEYSLFR